MWMRSGGVFGYFVTGCLCFLVQEVLNSWKDKITEERIHPFGRPGHLRFEPPLHQGYECSCHVGRHRCKQLVRSFLFSFPS